MPPCFERSLDKFDNWQSAREMANIDAGLDLFDNGLRKLAAADRHVYFLDDRALFRSLWGERDGQGRPLYKTLHLSPGCAVTNTSGDDPHNAVVAGGHCGVVWNTLWAQHLHFPECRIRIASQTDHGCRGHRLSATQLRCKRAIGPGNAGILIEVAWHERRRTFARAEIGNTLHQMDDVAWLVELPPRPDPLHKKDIRHGWQCRQSFFIAGNPPALLGD
ncbi:hypothetical protein R69658_04717 [Paraburkholderia aspalathi]|uniref:Uncharacterized protein n=1 Tax=Paraburkholderia aspalathi TaxID=1324617 RepID=A0ABN7MCT7_9BURK|nr:hypothetical protein [Paraburkholderia aspalathi]CAE6795651.1 hypothetical protein R69658_04717 [Paraburkholderia aspalathi]